MFFSNRIRQLLQRIVRQDWAKPDAAKLFNGKL
jgi:hypothetical protein